MCITNEKNCSWKRNFKKLELVPLSNNFIQSRVSDLSSDTLDQFIANIKAVPWKSLSSYNWRNNWCWKLQKLIALVRCMYDGTIMKEFLFCESLKRTTKAKDFIQSVNIFFAKHDLGPRHPSYWFCVYWRCPSYVGKRIGFFCFLKIGYSALAGYSLFSSLTCLSIKNVVLEIENFPWYICEGYQLD